MQPKKSIFFKCHDPLQLQSDPKDSFTPISTQPMKSKFSINRKSQSLDGFQSVSFNEELSITDRELNPFLTGTIYHHSSPDPSSQTSHKVKELDLLIQKKILLESKLEKYKSQNKMKKYFKTHQSLQKVQQSIDSLSGEFVSEGKSTHSDSERKNIRLKCFLCPESPYFHPESIVSMGEFCYLAIAPKQFHFKQGTFVIAPIHHSQSISQTSDEEFDELRKFQFSLEKMITSRAVSLKKQPGSYLFVEVSSPNDKLNNLNHWCVYCIPMTHKIASTAVGYVKKAFQDLLDQPNKKIISTQHSHHNHIDYHHSSTIRAKIPPEFDYIHVEVGINGGYAQVINKGEHWNPRFTISLIETILGKNFTSNTSAPPQYDAQLLSQLVNLFHPYDWTLTLNS